MHSPSLTPPTGSWTADFLDFEGVAYLNAAFQGPLPRVALAAPEAGIRLKTHPFEIRDSDYFTLPDAYRAEAAALLGAAPEDVAVTDSTIHAISCLTNGLDWRRGDEVLVPRGEFPSNRFPWLALERQGVIVRELAIPKAAAAATVHDAAARAGPAYPGDRRRLGALRERTPARPRGGR